MSCQTLGHLVVHLFVFPPCDVLGLDNKCSNVMEFVNSWQLLVGMSHEAKFKFSSRFQRKCPYINNHTRWYTKFDVIQELDPVFDQLESFLEGNS